MLEDLYCGMSDEWYRNMDRQHFLISVKVRVFSIGIEMIGG